LVSFLEVDLDDSGSIIKYSHMAIQHQVQLDRTFHALGDGTRREMLALLSREGECTASELGAPFDIAQPSVSKHIRVLETANLVSRRVEGRVHRFRLLAEPLQEAQTWITLHQEFWSNSLDALGEALKDIGNDNE